MAKIRSIQTMIRTAKNTGAWFYTRVKIGTRYEDGYEVPVEIDVIYSDKHGFLEKPVIPGSISPSVNVNSKPLHSIAVDKLSDLCGWEAMKPAKITKAQIEQEFGRQLEILDFVKQEHFRVNLFNAIYADKEDTQTE